MTEKEIKEELCYYDLRNPENMVSYGLTKDEIKEEGYGNHSKKDCYCDNCFYGRTRMAEELLKYVPNGVNETMQVEPKISKSQVVCDGCGDVGVRYITNVGNYCFFL